MTGVSETKTPSIATEADIKALQKELNRVAKPFTGPPSFAYGMLLVARDVFYCATIAYETLDAMRGEATR